MCLNGMTLCGFLVLCLQDEHTTKPGTYRGNHIFQWRGCHFQFNWHSEFRGHVQVLILLFFSVSPISSSSTRDILIIPLDILGLLWSISIAELLLLLHLKYLHDGRD